ncbi:hypothetical protein FLP41_15090 [Paracoccus marcusii]|uniref:hypothetical protein n=1 Tax=Paracoccus marcusii TaxID=59779 RepID=UPI0012F080A5|nr:hypothetical protein FLP41_15090 [Paracoccus marcusii]
MTIRQLVAVSVLESEIDREKIKSSAIAGRVAQADKRSWTKAMSELSDEKPRKRQEMIASVGEEVDPRSSREPDVRYP